jgi:DNA-binding FadR family transcriptional regulator
MELKVSDADLARVLKPAKGARPKAQVRVVQAIIKEWGNKDTGKLPNLAELGRRIGVRRQVVSTAIRALRKKGVLAVTEGKEPVVSQRTVRLAKVTLPDLDQYALPFELPEDAAVPQAELAAA